MDDGLHDALAGRDGWRVTDGVAVYQPAGSNWSGRVRPLVDSVRMVTRWHAAVVEGGAARHTRSCREPGEAVAWTQRVVDAQQP